jgi:hypothetical protein
MLAVGLVASMAVAKPVTGTWTFVDATPDPTVVLDDATLHCSGKTVPSSPADVNVQTFKAKKRGTLTLTSHNAADWAMEVRDSAGNTIAGTDGADPNTVENLKLTLLKGKYQIVYCNFSGEPTITVDYSFR